MSVSDQTTINMATVGADTLARTGRCRITSIQGEGIASATIILYDSNDASSPGTAVATFNYNTEGLAVYVPIFFSLIVSSRRSSHYLITLCPKY